MTEVEERRASTSHMRLLGPADLANVCRLLDRDSASNVFVRHRVSASRLDPRWFGAELWGWFDDAELVSVLHVGTNIAPAMATEAAIEAFGEALIARRSRPGSLVGPASMVLPLWERVAHLWGPARSLRPSQPFMRIDHDSRLPLDPRVRPVLLDELDIYYPACVAMFTEELGFHPETGNAHGYRARVAQLISMGWAWAVIDRGRVLFKAEVGSAGPEACQIQGVWVDPSLRGQGLAAPAMASVVRQARRQVAPLVTLYVNDHNLAARRAYQRVGFRETGTFASILL